MRYAAQDILRGISCAQYLSCSVGDMPRKILRAPINRVRAISLPCISSPRRAPRWYASSVGRVARDYRHLIDTGSLVK